MRYRFNGCELDVGARTISDGRDVVHVEPQVFDLVLYLIEQRARIVDKDELLARVWKGRVVSDATIASRINAARRAVGDDGRRQAVIATASRRGFRFVAEVSADDDRMKRPAVAVMAFASLSEDRSGDYLARGLADQLAATLGQAAWFDVRDTAASFAPVHDGKTPSDVGRALDADYLVFGTLQQADARVRLNLRLVEAADERQIWASSFSGGKEQIFDLQDRMASEVLGEIEPRLRRTELQKSASRHGDFRAFDHYLRATDLLRAMDLPGMKAAIAELDRATAAEPGYAAAHGMRAWIATLMLSQGQRVDERQERERCRLALEEGGFDCDALAMAGYSLGFFERDPLLGLDYLRRAVALNPSSARAHDHAGWLHLYAGHADEALGHFDRAIALCPMDEFGFRMLTGRAFAHLFGRDFAAAVQDARRAQVAAPSYTVCHRVLAAALAHLGRDAEARAVAKSLLAINPGLSVARYGKETRFERPADREILLGGLRRAGLP